MNFEQLDDPARRHLSKKERPRSEPRSTQPTSPLSSFAFMRLMSSGKPFFFMMRRN